MKQKNLIRHLIWKLQRNHISFQEFYEKTKNYKLKNIF